MAILGICCKKDSQCGTNARDTFTQAQVSRIVLYLEECLVSNQTS